MLGANLAFEPWNKDQVQAGQEEVVANSGASSAPVLYSCGEMMSKLA
eukprot:CAMPEP_0204079338 /NCGR_PEP_ID=MMETSP0360-20130528/172273_1 /ASSEMBLY_ACC=CAM_ASM_000342 /TAXON_ID=268821 /ORGANISM="Scrippsiella Hangoei, Strain SHTV-5" /LENGTH=46 /DNA_ID= /DNA_START= /DNA_END= /DNA_ORIENTATION=